MSSPLTPQYLADNFGPTTVFYHAKPWAIGMEISAGVKHIVEHGHADHLVEHAFGMAALGPKGERIRKAGRALVVFRFTDLRPDVHAMRCEIEERDGMEIDTQTLPGAALPRALRESGLTLWFHQGQLMLPSEFAKK